MMYLVRFKRMCIDPIINCMIALAIYWNFKKAQTFHEEGPSRAKLLPHLKLNPRIRMQWYPCIVWKCLVDFHKA